MSFASLQWVERFDRLKLHGDTTLRVMPDKLGPVPEGGNVYERHNLWQLRKALGYGPEKVQLVALWGGRAEDRPGGTGHMIEMVRRGRGWFASRTWKDLGTFPTVGRAAPGPEWNPVAVMPKLVNNAE